MKLSVLAHAGHIAAAANSLWRAIHPPPTFVAPTTHRLDRIDAHRFHELMAF